MNDLYKVWNFFKHVYELKIWRYYINIYIIPTKTNNIKRGNNAKKQWPYRRGGRGGFKNDGRGRHIHHVCLQQQTVRLITSNCQCADCKICLACSRAHPAANTNWLIITCSLNGVESMVFFPPLYNIHNNNKNYTRAPLRKHCFEMYYNYNSLYVNESVLSRATS